MLQLICPSADGGRGSVDVHGRQLVAAPARGRARLREGHGHAGFGVTGCFEFPPARQLGSTGLRGGSRRGGSVILYFQERAPWITTTAASWTQRPRRLFRLVAPHAGRLPGERGRARIPPFRLPGAASQVGSGCVGSEAPGDFCRDFTVPFGLTVQREGLPKRRFQIRTQPMARSTESSDKAFDLSPTAFPRFHGSRSVCLYEPRLISRALLPSSADVPCVWQSHNNANVVSVSREQ